MYRVLLRCYAAYLPNSKRYDKALAGIDSQICLLPGRPGSNYILQQLSKADLLVKRAECRLFRCISGCSTTIHRSDNTIKPDAADKAKYNIDKVAEEEQLKSDIQLTALVIVGIVLAILLSSMLRICARS